MDLLIAKEIHQQDHTNPREDDKKEKERMDKMSTCKSGEAEHSGLREDVVPSARSLEGLEIVKEQLPHTLYPLSHALYSLLPGL